MRIIPCLRGAPVEYNGYGAVQPSGAPIMQLKELEPDWGRLRRTGGRRPSSRRSQPGRRQPPKRRSQPNPHPLPKFRVNGPLANFPAFAEAFQCKAGDAMVRVDKDRCQIW